MAMEHNINGRRLLLIAYHLIFSTHFTLGDYPPLPYSAIWNSPTTDCFGTTLNLYQYDIVQNKRDAIVGGNVTLFPSIGMFPTITSSGDRDGWINGGLPQLGNLSLHLAEVDKDVQSLISDPRFSGLAVLNFKAWKPLYQHNFDDYYAYQNESMAYVLKLHPGWNKTQVEQEARREFNMAARSFLEGTLKRVRDLRPKARVGYLGYPECYGVSGYFCNDVSMQENDELRWLWDASGALYPQVYFKSYEQGGDKVLYLVSSIHESNRIISKRSVSTPLYIYLYSRHTYEDETDKFYSVEDINTSHMIASILGVDGVVIWGIPAPKSICSNLLHYISQTFGPAVAEVHDWTVDCSMVQCNNHGQCVSDKREEFWEFISKGVQPARQLLRSKRDGYVIADSADKLFITYVCRCYYGWQGDQCQTSKGDKH